MTEEPTQLPIACSLGTGDLMAQERRWVQLVRTAGTGRRATADGVELRFRADEGVERALGELVAIERDCCAWASWEVHRRPEHGDLAMRARAAGDGAATLQAMFLRDA